MEAARANRRRVTDKLGQPVVLNLTPEQIERRRLRGEARKRGGQ
jgi:hypothetical protein